MLHGYRKALVSGLMLHVHWFSASHLISSGASAVGVASTALISQPITLTYFGDELLHALKRVSTSTQNVNGQKVSLSTAALSTRWPYPRKARFSASYVDPAFGHRNALTIAPQKNTRN
jgi:hypothetical protein